MAEFSADEWIEKTRGLTITCIATQPNGAGLPSTFNVNYEGEPRLTKGPLPVLPFRNHNQRRRRNADHGPP